MHTRSFRMPRESFVAEPRRRHANPGPCTRTVESVPPRVQSNIEGGARPARRIRNAGTRLDPGRCGPVSLVPSALDRRPVQSAQYGWAAARLLRAGRAVDPRADPGRADLAPVTREGGAVRDRSGPGRRDGPAPPRVVRSTEIGVYAQGGSSHGPTPARPDRGRDRNRLPRQQRQQQRAAPRLSRRLRT